MIASTRGRYALRVMIDIAENSNGNYIAMKEVSHRQGVSLKYLEKIMPLLVSHNIVEGIHGKGGGYKLTRKPEDYTVGEILRLTEGELSSVACPECGSGKCDRSGDCRTLPMWNELNKRINEYLDSITLADLMKQQS